MIYEGKNIRNIIFDLGGVLLNIDYNLCVEAFRELGMENFNSLYSKAKQSDLFDRFEEGKVSSLDFRNEMRKFLKPEISDVQIDCAWNAMLLDFPKERLNLLNKLRNDYKIFLLSNTNEIHFRAVSEILKENFGPATLSSVFDKEYYSHLINLRKPNKEAFELLLIENNLNAEETLFIDDSPQHIEGAKNAGLQTYHLGKGKTILDLF